MPGNSNPDSNEPKANPTTIAKALKGINYPASKLDIIEHARGNADDDQVIEVLERIPDRQYGNMADLEKGVGQVE